MIALPPGKPWGSRHGEGNLFTSAVNKNSRFKGKAVTRRRRCLSYNALTRARARNKSANTFLLDIVTDRILRQFRIKDAAPTIGKTLRDHT